MFRLRRSQNDCRPSRSAAAVSEIKKITTLFGETIDRPVQTEAAARNVPERTVSPAGRKAENVALAFRAHGKRQKEKRNARDFEKQNRIRYESGLRRYENTAKRTLLSTHTKETSVHYNIVYLVYWAG